MKLFVKTGCVWCNEATAWLRDHGYAFEEINVSRDSAGFSEMVRLSHQTLAPTLEVHGEVLADFDTAQLARFLDRHAIRPG